MDESYDIPGAVIIADVDGESLIDFSSIYFGVNRMAVGDLNGDERPDIVAVDYTVNSLLHR